MNNKLKILVVGECNSGKSRITQVIRKALSDNDVDCDFEPMEFKNINDFERIMEHQLDDALFQINKNANISIHEFQLSRNRGLAKHTIGEIENLFKNKNRRRK